MQMFIALEP